MKSPRKILTIVGARPQFIKAAPVSLALKDKSLLEVIVHTGQHYDYLMSDIFFETLDLPSPKYNLEVGSGLHGAQTGKMLAGLEEIMLKERPSLVLVYGDTNSTLSGALAAVKLHIPVAHVEAGLRSFNRTMPEEINRIVTDHVSEILFAPTDAAERNLKLEGLSEKIIRTGDVMYDTVKLFQKRVGSNTATVLDRYGVIRGGFFMATVHRAENTDNPDRWEAITQGLSRIAEEVAPVIWPVHPRVRDRLNAGWSKHLIITEPLSYFDMQALINQARAVLTDSGGLQKEAAFHETPCITLRDETEWVELVDAGVNVLVVNPDARTMVVQATSARWPASVTPFDLFGKANTSLQIAVILMSFLRNNNKLRGTRISRPDIMES